LEQQKAAAAAQYEESRQKLDARRKAIEDMPAVAAAKKVSEPAIKAYNDFIANNAAYVKFAKDRKEANEASTAALENAKKADTEYLALRKQGVEVAAKRQAAQAKLQSAAPAEQELVKQEIAALDKEVRDIEQKKTDRRKAMADLPELAAAAKAAAAAESAYQEFVKGNVEYVKLDKDRSEAEGAYRKAQSEAQAADADYKALYAQRDAARGVIRDLEKKIAEAKKTK
jgi:hypothetical protein